MNKQGSEFDRGDLAREIVARFGDQMDDAETQEDAVLTVLKGISAILPDALAEFGRIEWHDLGVFAVQARQRKTGEDEEGNPLFEPTGTDKISFRPAPFVESILSSRTGRTVE